METQGSAERIDVRSYVQPIWSRRWLVLAVVVIATAATYLYFDRQPREYTASTDVFVQVSELDRTLFGSSVDSDPDRNTANQASFLRSRAVASRVARQVHYKGPAADLTKKITVERAEGNDFITIRATDSTPIKAAGLANAFAQALIRLREASTRDRVQAATQVAQHELAQLGPGRENQTARRSLRAQIRRLQVISSLPAGRVEQVDRAEPPGAASAPKPKRNAAFALFVSLVLACAAALLLDRSDRRIKRPERLEEVYGLPLLTTVPRGKPIGRDSEGRAGIPDQLRESFRTLRTNLDLQSLDRPLRTILVTSAMPSEGKSCVVRNLALAYGEAGHRVAVVEADLRQPTFEKMFQVSRKPGLTDVLANQQSLVETLQTVTLAAPPLVVEAGVPDVASGNGHSPNGGYVAVMTSGPHAANPPAVLAAERAKDVLSELAEHNDIVIIDSPPVLSVSDAIPLISAVDGVLLVARVGMTREDAARWLVEVIGRVPNANILGVVANAVPDAHQAYGYYGY
jgi:Mrp family chromosome partitioning ATPase/capsular polysaccharide biosynthesis protein